MSHDGADERERVKLSVQATSTSGEGTAWKSVDIEAGFLNGVDWVAGVTLGEKQEQDKPKRPFLVEKTFTAKSGVARLYASALGVYEISINSKRVGDHILAPGWQSYKHRQHYQVYELDLKEGENTISAWVGEGWWAGRLGFGGGWRNNYGDDLGLIAQIEVDGKVVLQTGDDGWTWRYGKLSASEIYDGENYDFTAKDEAPKPARSMSRPKTKWISPEAPPVRQQEVVQAIELITTPSGKKVLDFGQNLVGFARIIKPPPSNTTLTLKHAEVLEHEELGTRPLRICKATDVLNIGDGSDAVGHEPKFTFHGFRYMQVEGWEDVSADSFEAVVIYSDMERTGDFECSHTGLTRYHLNTLWGLRGNFVSVPTDCPQRDERLGWTGDLQAICSTASYLYDTMGLLGNWLDDVAVEQLASDNKDKGVPPITVPNIIPFGIARFAIWGDVTSHAPKDLYAAFGDVRVLEEQWESMTAWVDYGVLRAESGLWTNDQWQLGDWLDPTAPDDAPGDTHSDGTLVANCFLLKTIEILAYIGSVLGKDDAKRYQEEHAKLLKAFRDEYITPNGLITSDTQTTLALALHFKLVPEKNRQHMADRLVLLIRKKLFKISTGFAGTPVILLALAETGHLNIAYRMFQEKQCPSLLYPISMGATTIWERWNSMLPDGSINPGEMTSFNHYASGSVSRFLYEKTGGLSILEPGWKKAMIAPQPGGTVTHASVSHTSAYGKHECSWRIDGKKLKVDIKVPPNTTARVQLPSVDEEVGSGSKSYTVDWEADPSWPPKMWHAFNGQPTPLDEVVE